MKAAQVPLIGIGTKVRVSYVDMWHKQDGFKVGDLAVIDAFDEPSTPDDPWIYVLLCEDHHSGAWFSHHELEIVQ